MMNYQFKDVCSYLYLLVILGCLQCGWCLGKFEEEPATAQYAVEAVQGGVAKLPCDITPDLFGDKLNLVIWFKEGSAKKTPIYSFDSRDKKIEEGKHWADDTVLGGRAHFRLQDDPARLTLDSVKYDDSGVYHCRVDFKKSPTKNVKVNLTVIIPPEKLSVLNANGTHISSYILGPYNEGSSVNITCEATGGRPSPRVTWWQENALLDDTFVHLPNKRVQNVLHLDKLQRKHLHSVFTCQASNNNLIAPISSSVTLDMNLRPLWVKLLNENKPLSANNMYQLKCEVVGSKPTPTITWWMGSVKMNNTKDETSTDTNTTISTLTFTPTVEDGGKYLSCRGQQQQISDSGIEKGWTLNIYHVPIVTLELGSNLNGSIIKEGVDVYFECNIKSNPWVSNVKWRHNGQPLLNNIMAGTIVSNQSLVLQSVTRARTGFYTCVGYNREGEGESKPVHLDVKFAPVCRPGQPNVYGVARNEPAKIPCELEGNPAEFQFTWRFNHSGDAFDLPQSQIRTDRGRSVAVYTPMTELDYGTLLCWGSNEIGVQKEPCIFYINPAGKPDALSNCTILNQTANSLHVECIEGFDGGLQQEFVMEVYDAQTNNLVSNVTSRNPILTAVGLESGLDFVFDLYAVNKKGRSEVRKLQASTLKSAEKHTVQAYVANERNPVPPENCTIINQNRYYLQIKCRVAVRDTNDTYLLQVYDANTRLLLGTATSQNAESVTITSLPRDHDALLLFVRTITAKSIASDAAILYAPSVADLDRLEASAPTHVFLQITPILGVLIGVVAALILVAVVIVIVIRLRGGGERDDKDYDDGGLSSTGRRCAAGNGDKASIEPLNKDLNDSVDSLEEKNPDIIPQNNGEDDYQDEERAFDRLNNAPLRVYSRIQSPNNAGKNGPFDGYVKANDEITYAELSLTNQQIPHVIYKQQPIPMSMIRRQEPTVYAQIDMSKRMPPPPSCMQPLSPPHPSAFQAMHHLQTYIPRPIREEQRIHDGSGTINAETPLINARESNAALQPLIEGGGTMARVSTLTATTPRLTATRF